MKKLSLITTVYKKERVVIEQLTNLYTFLEKKGFDFEIIAVIDGEVDNSKRNIKKLIKENSYENIKLYSYKENRGKGYALRYGFKKATGDVVGYIDADTDIELRTLDILIDEMEKGSVVAIPSKLHKYSNVSFSPIRKVISKSFRLLNHIFVPLPKGVEDVSCGVKLFRADIIKEISNYLSVDGFAIDSEILFYVNRLGVDVKVTPFYADINTHKTTVTFVKSLRMFLDILKIYRKSLVDSSNTVSLSKVNLNIDKHTTL